MARNGDVVAGNKRKLANGAVKEKTGSKKTKFEKPSPVSEESESVSEPSDAGAFSDDNEEDGGAQLHPDRVNRVQGEEGDGAKTFEKGESPPQVARDRGRDAGS